MIRIRASTENLFLFWAGDPDGRIEQISTAIGSFCHFNPASRVFLFTNELSHGDLDPRLVGHARFRLVRWTPEELVEQTPFESRAHELEPDFIASRHDGDTPIWVSYSNFFRYVVLWRWGGTYLDLDDISIAPLPGGTNMICSSIPSTHAIEPGFGALFRDPTARQERYFRIGTHPLVRFVAGHELMRRCLELALDCPPGISGSRTLTRSYAALANPADVVLHACIDFQLHQGIGMSEFVRRHADVDEKWWWIKYSEPDFRRTWPAIRRLGTFFSIKNHDWLPADRHAERRVISQWVGEDVRNLITGNQVCRRKTSISVIVPTYRQRHLAVTLDALARQTDEDFEVIIVENGTNETRTRRLVDRFEQLIRVKYVFEPRLGINVARNTGACRASGSVLAFIDDDCEPSPGWISSIRTRHDAMPDGGVVAGSVRLAFDTVEPGWVHGRFRALLSELDLDRATDDTGRWVVGANFSVSRRWFDEAGGFDEATGMVGRSPVQLGNDEAEFCTRVERLSGTAVVYDSGIDIRHRVPTERLTMKRFEQRAFGQGISDALLISNRELRPVDSILEKLETTLYDPHWLDVLCHEADGVPASCRQEFVTNGIRVRLAYLGGLVEGCMKVGSSRPVPRSILDRYRRAGMRSASRWLTEGDSSAQGLGRAARLAVGAAIDKKSRYHRYVRPAVLVGRAVYLAAAKDTLTSMEDPTDSSTSAIASCATAD